MTAAPALPCISEGRAEFMAELISQVTGFEAIMAAVVNGADAVYLSFDYEKAGYRATEMEIRRDAGYCRARDVRLYVSIEHFPADDEFSAAVEYARLSWRLGADAVVVSDVGLAKAIRTAAPDMPIHAGPRLCVFGKSALATAAAMGFSRVYLPKELSGREIAQIAGAGTVEAAVMVQGDMCSSISGHCFMGSLLGGKREAKGKCIRACRYGYSTIGHRYEYPLSLKDNCLIRYLDEMEKAGVAGFVISGLYRRPEYIAMATNVYYNYMHDMENMSVFDCTNALMKAYPGQDMTDGFYTGKKGESMIGTADCDQSKNFDYVEAKKDYKSREFNRVPVNFVAIIKRGEPVKLAAGDDKGNVVSVQGEVPREAGTLEIRRGTVITQCKMTGGTPYICGEVRTVIDKGLFFTGQEMGALVAEALHELTEKRKAYSERSVYSYVAPDKVPDRKERPKVTVSVLRESQLSEELFALAPEVLYIPIEHIKSPDGIIKKFIQSPVISVCAVLPKVMRDGELAEIAQMMKNISDWGIDQVCVSNISHIVFARRCGFKVRGDIGLGVSNSESLSIYEKLGLSSAVLSPELRLDQIGAMSKPMDTEIVGYGRLPLMYTDNCIIKNSSGFCPCDSLETITDPNGMAYPVSGGFGCRSTVYSAKKLFIGDKQEDYEPLGLWGIRLIFTSERPGECAKLTAGFMDKGNYEPTFYTRGVYYRDIE